MNDTPYHYDDSARRWNLDSIRQRPSMFIGDTTSRGFHHLLCEVMDNAIEEVMNGFCNEVTLTLHDETTVSVEDNGRGIPVKSVSDGWRPFLEEVMMGLHTGETRRGYAAHVGMHGVGLFVVGALCERMVVDVHRDGLHYRMECACGVPVGGMKVVGESDRRGTAVTLTPDPEVFGDDKHFLPEWLCGYLHELACLNPEAVFRFRNTTNGDRMTFHYPSGIRRMLECDGNSTARPEEREVAYGCVDDEGMRVEIAFACYPWAPGSVTSYVNGIELYHVGSGVAEVWARSMMVELRLDAARKRGWGLEMLPAIVNKSILCCAGPEMVGFLSGVRRALVNEAMAMGVDLAPLKRLQLTEVAGVLNAVVSLRLVDVEVTGSTRTKLVYSKRIRCALKRLGFEMMSRFCAEHPDRVQWVVGRIASGRGENALGWLRLSCDES